MNDAVEMQLNSPKKINVSFEVHVHPVNCLEVVLTILRYPRTRSKLINNFKILIM